MKGVSSSQVRVIGTLHGYTAGLCVVCSVIGWVLGFVLDQVAVGGVVGFSGIFGI